MPVREKQRCEIKGCENESVRSVPVKNLLKALPGVKIEDEKRKRVHICKEHYKKFKKATREERELQRLGW